MKTQNFKSISLRTMFDNALAGRPINCHSVTLFDLSDIDLDDDSKIILDNDFGDSFENLQDFRDFSLYKREQSKNGKEVLKNETSQTQNEKTETLPSE